MNKKKAYVIGTNVSTSLSPAIFEYWFKKYPDTGFDIDALSFDSDHRLLFRF